VRAVGPPLQLWDVRNVEAHVARAVEAGLDRRSAHLSPSQYDRCFQFCLQKVWELSGLKAGFSRDNGDGTALRYVYEIRGAFSPRGMLDSYQPFRLKGFTTEDAAERALAELRETKPVAFGQVHAVRPKGAYDRTKGISFTTYSYRQIVDYRIDDWYRSDPEFGDTRYESNRRVEESLEALASRHRDDEDAGDTSDWLPGTVDRLSVIDSLNQHAYQDAGEEVLTREAFGFGG